MIPKIVEEIRNALKKNIANLNEEQKKRLFRIINPDKNNYKIYGIRVATIDTIVKTISKEFKCSYDDAIEIFKELMRSDIEEEKFAGFLFLNQFKKDFNHNTVKLFQDTIIKYCHSWSVLDSISIRVLGPFLAKKENEELAVQTINIWSDSENMWIKRASMVILLKIIMLKKEFENTYVLELVDKMIKYSDQNYIEKGIGWLLKTCSKYKPDLIFEYLVDRKDKFSRLILRYASEKLSKKKRIEILKK